MLKLLANHRLGSGKLVVVVGVVQLERPLGVGGTASACKRNERGKQTSSK